MLTQSLEKLHSCCLHIKIPHNQTRNQGCCLTFHRNTSINYQAMSVRKYLQSTKIQPTKNQGRKNQTKRPNSAQTQTANQSSLQEALTQLLAYSPACEVGVRGVGGATSCVPLILPEAVEGNPRTAGFRVCLNLSSRSRLSRSASSAALLAPYRSRVVNSFGDY